MIFCQILPDSPVVRVSISFTVASVTGSRGGGIGLRRPQPFRILGELVHVDDVRHAAELVQGRERLAAFQTALERNQEEHGGAEKDEAADRRVEGLNELRESLEAADNRTVVATVTSTTIMAAMTTATPIRMGQCGRRTYATNAVVSLLSVSSSPATRARPESGKRSVIRSRSRVRVPTIRSSSSCRYWEAAVA